MPKDIHNSRFVQVIYGQALSAAWSCQLWLCHVISGLAGSAGHPRVVVDYDCLMESPDREIGRMARIFGLDVDPLDMETYRSEFLDNQLRHSVFAPSDFGTNDSCPILAKKVYGALLDAASDRLALDDSDFLGQVARWTEELELSGTYLGLADKLFQEVLQLRSMVAERDNQIRTLSSEMHSESPERLPEAVS
jgi:hypothetical protein